MSGPKADAILARDQAAKKKKRKQATSNNTSNSSGNIAIVDDDAGWGRPIKVDNDDEDDVKDAVVASDRSFKKRRRVGEDGGWISLPPEDQEQAQEIEAEDEKPVVVNQDAQPQMTGGLMSHADLEARFATTQLANKKGDGPTEEQMETVYRDATGRKIDTKAARAEAARLKREKEEKEAKRMEWGKGIVQRDEREKARREMELERGKGFERRKDDQTLNEIQREEMRWNDPAAAFLSKTRTKGPKKPEYKGPPPPPNRFGIKPGYRWDGVDRSNGFEKKLFQRQNERQRKGLEAYQWSVDEM